MLSLRFIAGTTLGAMLGAMLCLLSACHRPPVNAPAARPAPEIAPQSDATPPSRSSVAMNAPSNAAVPPMKETAEDTPLTAPQLQAAYLAAKEFPDKVEVIYDLGNLDTADAIYTLMRLFEAEGDPDLKQEMIDATERMEEQLPAKLAFLAIALQPSQPAEIRDTAVGLLLTIEDRRAIAIWQLLLKDADPERREMAQERIEDLQQLEPN
ncbi:MAG: hypothetical protein WCF18_01315 [Chthoniobacteraceae bacterium]